MAATFPQADCPSAVPDGRDSHDNGDQAKHHRKPNCSYNVLAGMAMKASHTGALTVTEIYKYIEQEFPYFKFSPPKGWKSSIRHSLSFGQYFRKVERKGGYQPMKGLHWELVPGKKAALEKEMETFLQAEGRGLIENTDTLSDLQCILATCGYQDVELLLHNALAPLTYENGYNHLLADALLCSQLANTNSQGYGTTYPSTAPEGQLQSLLSPSINSHSYLSKSTLSDPEDAVPPIDSQPNSLLPLLTQPVDLHSFMPDLDLDLILQSVDTGDYSNSETFDKTLTDSPQSSASILTGNGEVELELDLDEVLDILSEVERKEKRRHTPGIKSNATATLQNEEQHVSSSGRGIGSHRKRSQCNLNEDLYSLIHQIPTKQLKLQMDKWTHLSDYSLENVPSDPSFCPSASLNESEGDCYDDNGTLSPLFSVIDEETFVQLVRDAKTVDFKSFLDQTEEVFEKRHQDQAAVILGKTGNYCG